MPLRDDLTLLPRPDAPGCLLRDERTGEEYEFGEIEHFLLEKFRLPCQIQAVRDECNARFGRPFSVEDIEGFLDLLREWGLFYDVAAQGEPTETASPQPALREEAGPVQPADWQRPNRWHLFKPAALLEALGRWLHPLPFLVWITPLIAATGAMAVIAGWDAFAADVSLATSRFGRLGRLLLATVSVNLAIQIARGVVARRFGLSTPSFGLVLLFGLIPRFNLQVIPAGNPGRAARLWLSGTSALVRLWIFGVAAILWAMTRPAGLSLSVIGVELVVISLIGLMLGANPLWPGDGATFLSALLEIPNIQKRSRSALLAFFVRRPSVIARHARRSLALGLFGLASLFLLAAVFGFIAFKAFTHLESHYRGAGVALFLLLGAHVSLTLRRRMTARSAARLAAPGGGRGRDADGRPASSTDPPRGRSAAMLAAYGDGRRGSRAKMPGTDPGRLVPAPSVPLRDGR